eukprot:s188_g28.t2
MAEGDLDGKEQDGGRRGRKLRPTCEVCEKVESRYRCPACEIRSCSAACVQAHKQESGCTGKRPRTERVAPLNAFTDGVLLRDFGLLEEVDAAVDRADRDLRIRDEEMKLYQPRRHKQRIQLARACAAPERQMRLILAPFAMSIARENSSRVVDGGRRKGAKGKGKGKKGQGSSNPGYISWRVDWHFAACSQVLTERAIPEHEVIGCVLGKFLNNSLPRGPTRHLLVPYAELGVEKLEVFLHQPPRTKENKVQAKELSDSEEESEESPVSRPAPLPPPPPPPDPLLSAPWRRPPPDQEESESEEEESEREEEAAEGEEKGSEADLCSEYIPYVRLDKSRTLRENLMDRAIVEYPMLHVAMPQDAAVPSSKIRKFSIHNFNIPNAFLVPLLPVTDRSISHFGL